MRRIWLTIAFFILVSLLFAYVYLGGFSDPKISIEESNTFVIAGYPYEGQMNVKAFGLNFNHADSLVENNIVKGKVAGYFYNQPLKGDDPIKAFVGVIPDDTSSIPPGIEKRSFPGRKIVQASIEAHYLIMPVNIYPRIREFAKENNIQISDESVEIYESDKKLVIQVPVL